MPTQYTRAEAAGVLQISLSTLDRKVARGELPIAKEPFGARERIYVLLEDSPPLSPTDDTTDDSPGNTTDDSIDPYVTILEAQVKTLQDLADYRQELLKEADLRLQMVLNSLGTAHNAIDALTRALPAPDPLPEKAKRAWSWLTWWKR